MDLQRALLVLRSPPVVWKTPCGDDDCRGCLLKIMVERWNTGTVPADWTSHYLTVLPKKGDLSLPANYRGTGVGESLSKVYSTILKHRLNDLHEQLAPGCCCGFRRGRGRMDCMHSQKLIAREKSEMSGVFWRVFRCEEMLRRASGSL